MSKAKTDLEKVKELFDELDVGYEEMVSQEQDNLTYLLFQEGEKNIDGYVNSYMDMRFVDGKFEKMVVYEC